jgi:dienelactone hydrolase
MMMSLLACSAQGPPAVGTSHAAGDRAAAGTAAPAANGGGGRGGGAGTNASAGGAVGRSSSAGSAGTTRGAGGDTTPSPPNARAATGGMSGAAVGGMGGMASADTGGTPAIAAGASFPAVSDLGADGPYMPMTVMNTGPNSNYTVYRPAELAPGGAKNPIVAWMSGGGSTPSQYDLLPHLASHGFVVVASNTSPELGAEVELGKEIIEGIDWILGENMASASDYFGKLDASKVASMGYSMGALATTTIAGDARLTTTVHISGGNMETDRVKMLHAPAAFVCGASGTDIAGANCASDFDAAMSPVFYAVFKGGDHLGVRTQPYAGRIQILVTGWLRWQLMSDKSLDSMFLGDQCMICKDPNWTVKQKGLQ